jgi:exo-1,4-beta-D-glucosaminidase
MTSRMLSLALLLPAAVVGAQERARLELRDGWQIQSSARVRAGGDSLSLPGYAADGWYHASVPTTVMAALVANHVYENPYFGTTLRDVPGAAPVGKNFANVPMPEGSPYRVAWWYRTTFPVPDAVRGRHLALHFDGINYRANIWLNGRRIATVDSVAGMFRRYEFDVTPYARAGQPNALALEIFAPDTGDLAMTWVDWNPAPPDKDMGLWRPVYLTASGPVTVRQPFVASRVDSTSAHRADLTVSVELHNLTATPVRGTLSAQVGPADLVVPVTLAPNELRVVRLTPARYPALHLDDARLWWPAGMGEQALSTLRVAFETGGAISDQDSIAFGVREITSEVTPRGGRLFRVNGRPFPVRGGGWAPDMMLRADTARQRAELQYVLDVHLNTVRMEGKLEDDHFFDLADRLGILVMAGWCCCDRWERWSAWTARDTLVAMRSEADQIRRLRSHASVLVWLNGSDNPPPPAVESLYVAVMRRNDWPNPVLSSATGKAAWSGPSGVKMTGPYDWVPPAYWLQDDRRGGAHGFNTETSPGAAIPPIESLRQMLPADHLWPIDSTWTFHAGEGQFTQLTRFTDALAQRYGPPKDVDDFAATSQLATYEGERAMFEGFARNRPRATGVIQWMLNDAWPSLIWHLYDWYLRPGGGYFGTKKALEPRHVMFSYDDRSIVVLNDTGDRLAGAHVSARAWSTDLAPLLARDTTVDVPAGGIMPLFTVPPLDPASRTYLLDLRLTSTEGRLLSNNTYWLAARGDSLDWEKSTWYTTPVAAYADLTGLRALPAATVRATPVVVARDGADAVARTTITNTGTTLAFFVRLQLVDARGEEILPVRWEDNYVTLLPGEKRTLEARYRAGTAPAAPSVVVSGWNVR